MADVFGIASAAIRSANTALQVTAHNIANANTEGYHRERVEFSALGSTFVGGNNLGMGVAVADIARMENDIVTRQRRGVASEAASLNQFENLGTQISEMFGESGYHLDEAMGDYFNSVRESADNPGSLPLRSVVLQRADEMAHRFSSLDKRLERLEADMAPQIGLEVREINELGKQLQDLNKKLGGGFAADNQILDRRDLVLDKLASKVTIDARFSDDGQVAVSIAKGHTIVDGIFQHDLRAVPDPQDANLMRVEFDNQGAGVDITDAIQGGALGGILSESRELLRDTRQSLGLLAASIVTESNNIHTQSIDLDGNLGSPLFDPIVPDTASDLSNTGTGVLETTIVDGTALQAKLYNLEYDGANWTVSDADGNSLMTGASLPLNIDGVEISLVAGAPNTGDRFSVSPSLGAAGRLSLNLEDARELALAQPVRAIEQADNSGNAAVQDLVVVNPADAALQTPVLIEFADPPTQYSIIDPANGTVLAAPAAYTSGAAIAFNGWELTVTGNPAAGDRIAVEGNADGLAGQNIGRLADLQTDKVMAGGNASVEDMYGALVADVGSRVSSAVNNAEAQGRVHQILTDRLGSSVGVSLDEEATRMIQYQRMFQASARVIQTAQSNFDTLMNSF